MTRLAFISQPQIEIGQHISVKVFGFTLYVDTIVRRWQKFTGKSAVHAESNRTFNEIEEKN